MDTNQLTLSEIIKSLESYLDLAKSLEIYIDSANSFNSLSTNKYEILLLQGGCVCERMLLYLLQQRGYSLKDSFLEIDGMPCTVFTFCQRKEIFPKEVNNYMDTIRRMRNEAAHSYRAIFTRENVKSFLEALFYFSVWFDDDVKAEGKVISVISESFLFSHFTEQRALWVQESSVGALNKKETDAQKILLALKELDQRVRQIDLRTQRMDQREVLMEQTINDIREQINIISNQISAYQSLVQRQIQMSISEDERDRIIQAFTDECVPRIVSNLRENNAVVDFERETQKLIATLGKSAWNKMDGSSKSFLISSKVMYGNLILLDDIVDYSGVCLLITKALEVELKKRFFWGFLEYLDKTYTRNYSIYHTALLNQNTPKRDEQISLGTMAYLLCLFESKWDTYTQRQNNHNKLIEYSKACLFSSLREDEIKALLKDYARKIESIKESFRNPAAHTGQIKRTTAEDCFNLIIDIEKLLKRMLDSFDV